MTSRAGAATGVARPMTVVAACSGPSGPSGERTDSGAAAEGGSPALSPEQVEALADCSRLDRCAQREPLAAAPGRQR